jgi:hypothetical protein
MVATLVTVAAYDNILEAGYWQAMLEAEGIPVIVADREIVAAEWQIARAVGQIKLQVPEPEAARAREILAIGRRASPRRSPGAPAQRALLAAFLGLLFPPLQLYALWLAARLFPRRRGLPARDRRRIALAALISLIWLPVIVTAYWVAS